MALLLCLGMAVVLITSSAFMIHEMNHDCIGEDCKVCEQIAVTSHLLRSLSLLGVILLALYASLAAAYKLFKHPSSNFYSLPTLVRWKVRLNN